jgi:hypothetical protein
MESLTIQSILTLINNLTYEDSERLKNIIFKEKINDLYRIVSNQCDDVDYYMIAKSEDEAIRKFIKTTEFGSDRDFDHHWRNFIKHDICKYCNKKVSYEDRELENLSKHEMRENHMKTHHTDEIISYYVEIFDKYYLCDIVSYYEIDESSLFNNKLIEISTLRCNKITNSGKKCSKRRYYGSDYCSEHYILI